jgi:hypothetical protein
VALPDAPAAASPGDPGEEHRAVRHPQVDAAACLAAGRPNGGPDGAGAISRSSSRRR